MSESLRRSKRISSSFALGQDAIKKIATEPVSGKSILKTPRAAQLSPASVLHHTNQASEEQLAENIECAGPVRMPSTLKELVRMPPELRQGLDVLEVTAMISKRISEIKVAFYQRVSLLTADLDSDGWDIIPECRRRIVTAEQAIAMACIWKFFRNSMSKRS